MDNVYLNMLPDVSQVNFGDVEDVTGYATYLYASSQLDVQRSATLKQAARTWVDNVRNVIGTFTPADALTVVNSYEMMHLIAFNLPAASVFLKKFRLNAFDALINGDSQVDEYEMFRTVSRETARRDIDYMGSPLKWQCESLGRWHRQFRTLFGNNRTTDHDTIEIVAILLGSNLWAFETSNEARYKNLLFSCHRHFLDDITGKDIMHLTSLTRFLAVAEKYLTHDEIRDMKHAISLAVLSLPAVNRYLRLAIKLKTAKRQNVLKYSV